ncbi:DUF402 domain-containing protein [Streptomyces sp. I6]|uniref:DUF402 domain-containing protein n=1 Tax=Streptomyces sp. I6 TaxID=2483113 RepID=UPI000F447AC4|nr:DUF402 domain-containing protein [Streptomyces sp. I6]RNL73436.1 DUF402 domain-containing protein [Streptomyces sp. I6]
MIENSADARGRRTVEVTLVHAGRTKIRYPAELLDDDGSRITVHAEWAASRVKDLGFVRFEPGDSFVERYWRDRWYAVKEVHTADGALKGWYAKVTRPSILDDGELHVEEMGLNLWVSADTATVLRLDEEAFASSDLRGRDPESASRAEAALDELEHMAKQGRWGELGRVP